MTPEIATFYRMMRRARRVAECLAKRGLWIEAAMLKAQAAAFETALRRTEK